MSVSDDAIRELTAAIRALGLSDKNAYPGAIEKLVMDLPPAIENLTAAMNTLAENIAELAENIAELTDRLPDNGTAADAEEGEAERVIKRGIIHVPGQTVFDADAGTVQHFDK